MKKCTECNIDMIENIKIEGEHPFEIGVDSKSHIYIQIPRKVFSKNIELKTRVCPLCGKVELYIDPQKLQEK